MVADGPPPALTDTVYGLLRARAQEDPGRPFLLYKDQIWSREELDRVSEGFARTLLEAGVEPGARAVICLPNGPEFLLSFFGAMKAGLIAVPVNTALKDPEVAHILKDSGAQALVALDGARDWASLWQARPPSSRHLLAGGLSKEALLSRFSAQAPIRERPPQASAAIIYTSGTTGLPKGAVLTHRNYVFDAEALARGIAMTEKDRFLCFLPLFHVNAQVVTLLAPLWSGGSMVLMDRFSPKEFLELLSSHRCTAFSAVPSVYSVMLGLPGASRYDLSSLRFCVCGAAPMPVEVFERFEAKFHAHILEGYGLSEAACVSSVNPPPPGRRKIGSIGLPLAGQAMRVVGEDGRELARGEVGELAVCGPNVMAGYWNNPAATAQVLRDGWLFTGDLGRQDSEGYFYIVGRKKEMIIRGGENIYPREIEEALYRHRAVLEAAVVGVPDRRWGEEVAAFVVLKPGAACSAKELTAFLKESLADYKLPRRVEFLDYLPKTATGKIQKHRLKA